MNGRSDVANNRWYTVSASTGPVEKLSIEVVEHLGGALAKTKSLQGTVVSADSLTRRVSMRGSLDAPSLGDATAAALVDVHRALAAIGKPALVDFRVLEDLAEDEFASARDDVVGTPEVAARLGISRQRVAQLVDQQGRFPTPIATVRGTHLWEWGDIADWIAAGARDMRRKQPSIEELQEDLARAKATTDNTVDLMGTLKRSIARAKQPEVTVAKRAPRSKVS
jgi:predicted DNA-binding transcriptional regulator AlpA